MYLQAGLFQRFTLGRPGRIFTSIDETGRKSPQTALRVNGTPHDPLGYL